MSLRAVVVGAGMMGRWHARAAVRAGATIVAVVDPRTQAAETLAHELGSTAHEALAPALTPPPNVVHVCTPDATHPQIAESALQAGAHALVEKPVGSAEAVDRLAAVARSRGLTLTPGHQMLFQGWAAALPSIGRVRSVEHRICSTGSSPDPRELTWGIAWHGLAIAHHILGDVDWTPCWAGADLAAVGVAGGATVSLGVSLGGRPPRNRLTVVGEAGTIEADLALGHHTVQRGGTSRAAKLSRPFRASSGESLAAARTLASRAVSGENAFPGLRPLTRAVYAHVRGEAPPALPASHLPAVARAAEAIRP